MDSAAKSETRRGRPSHGKPLRLERLEAKLPLAVVWANEFATGDADPEFDQVFGEQEHLARALVNRAIDDWNEVVLDLNYDHDNDPTTNADAQIELTIVARDLETEDEPGATGARSDTFVTEVTDGGPGQIGWQLGVPTAATIRIDDDAGRINPFTRDPLGGWFLDATPLDDAEFTSVADPFSASFVDVKAVAEDRLTDLYYTVLNEIGHAVGFSTFHEDLAIIDMLTPLVDDNGDPIRDLGVAGEFQLTLFEGANVSATMIGSNLYEGSAVYVAEGVAAVQPDPTMVFKQGDATPIDFLTHPNQLMNLPRIAPAGGFDPVGETARLLISDLTVQILADAYGYEVALPSATNNAYVALDDITGTLLVQGRPRDATTGDAADDAIRLTKDGDQLVVEVNEFVERVPFDQVREILFYGNGGADDLTVDDQIVTQPIRLVDFVVTSNDDAIETPSSLAGSNTANGVIDLNTFVPGNQVTLRAAMIEAGNVAGQGTIYLPRGHYYLTRPGGQQSGGDLDVQPDANVVLLGAGAGLSVVDASEIDGGHRVFEVEWNNNINNPQRGSLVLSRLSVTGGNVAEIGAGIGGGILNHGSLTLDQVAVVDNRAKPSAGGNGGGIYNRGGQLKVIDSVFAHNRANLGAAIRTFGTSQLGAGRTTIEGTVIAFHTGQLPDVFTSGGVAATTSKGDNLVDVGFEGPFDHPTDRVDNADAAGAEPESFVVTSLADTFTGGDLQPYDLSLREAIALAHDPNEPASLEIWAPAWDFTLYRFGPRDENGFARDHDIAFGDLDVGDDLRIQFAGDDDATVTQSRAEYRGPDADHTFDLWGDFNSGNAVEAGGIDPIVDGADLMIYQRTPGSTTDLRADANDDGIVSAADFVTFWNELFGNSLDIEWT